jgi:hypothetical protein
MLLPLDRDRKRTLIFLEKVHSADLLVREERLAADPTILIDLGLGDEARQHIQTPEDLEQFLDLAEAASDGLHLLELAGTDAKLYLHRRGKVAELGSRADLALVFDPGILDEAIAQLHKAGAREGRVDR